MAWGLTSCRSPRQIIQLSEQRQGCLFSAVRVSDFSGPAVVPRRRTHLAPGFYCHATVAALRDPPSPHGQFVLLVYCLQFSTHKNTPVSRIVRLSRIYYPLLYGSIVSYRRIQFRPLLDLTLTLCLRDCTLTGKIRQVLLAFPINLLQT